MTQKTSAYGRQQIEAREGNILHAYKDSVGVETIGVGHTAAAGGLKPVAGMTITAEQSDALLTTDLAKYEARVAKRFGKTVPQNVFDGAVSFDFNTGGIDTATWVPLYLKGNMIKARAHFMLWDKPKEIIGRRTKEANQIFAPVDPYPGDLQTTESKPTEPQSQPPTSPYTSETKNTPTTGTAPIQTNASFFSTIINWLKGLISHA